MIIKTTEEIRQHTSVISAANDFEELKSYIKRATRYLIRYIGDTTYNAALAHYKSGDYTNPNDQLYQPNTNKEKLDRLVDHIQDAVVNYALFLYVPQGNIILGDDGFKVTWTESQRPAQEWQVKKVEKSILTTAHELFDDLLDYLEANVDEFDFWDASEKIKENRARFINSAREFSKWFNIDDSRRLFLLLLPLLDEVERKHITPELGETKTAEIREQILDDDTDISAANQTILDLVRPAEAVLTMYLATSRYPKKQLVPFDELDRNALRDAGFANLQELSAHMNELENAMLDDDEQLTTEYKPSDYDDDDLTDMKTFSV